MTLTIAYVTARRDPKVEWFLSSLALQSNEPIPIIVVSLFPHLFSQIKSDYFTLSEPKPNVWQGEHRLTKQDWFAMANARNTALCLCDTDWIAYVDDLSVLETTWLDCVKEAMEGRYNVAGSYRKVKNLVVENGLIKSFTPFSEDCRMALSNGCLVDCDGGWLYGCSCAFKVEDLLDVGGWPEYCDGLGAEDYCLGIALKNAGKTLVYCKPMATMESEEHHHTEPSLRRTDKGVSPNDKSHAALNIAKSSKYFPNYYPGGMRALREFVLAGNPFPVIQQPRHDWFDGQLISEMQ